MANMFLVREQLITFKLCSSINSYGEDKWSFLKEHVISQEVKMLTQRKMFDLAKLNKQLVYLDWQCQQRCDMATLNEAIYMYASLST